MLNWSEIRALDRPTRRAYYGALALLVLMDVLAAGVLIVKFLR